MNDAQIWATIILAFCLLWHGINVWARTRVVRFTVEQTKDAKIKAPLN